MVDRGVGLGRRAQPNRGGMRLGQGRSASVTGTVALDIGRIRARQKTSRRPARDGRRRRRPLGEGRLVRRPRPCPQRERAPVAVYGGHIKEPQAPAGGPPVEWMPLTTRPIHTAAEALRMLE